MPCLSEFIKLEKKMNVIHVRVQKNALSQIKEKILTLNQRVL